MKSRPFQVGSRFHSHGGVQGNGFLTSCTFGVVFVGETRGKWGSYRTEAPNTFCQGPVAEAPVGNMQVACAQTTAMMQVAEGVKADGIGRVKRG